MPLPSTLAFWYDADWGVFVFKRGMDALYAATSAAGPLWDAFGPAAGLPAVAALMGYYAVVRQSARSRQKTALA